MLNVFLFIGLVLLGVVILPVLIMNYISSDPAKLPGDISKTVEYESLTIQKKMKQSDDITKLLNELHQYMEELLETNINDSSTLVRRLSKITVDEMKIQVGENKDADSKTINFVDGGYRKLEFSEIHALTKIIQEQFPSYDIIKTGELRIKEAAVQHYREMSLKNSERNKKRIY